MADNVQLASFQFDTARLEASLDKLQTSFFNLKKEQEGYNNLAREQQKAINALTAENLKLAASGKETSKEYAENTKQIEELNAAQQQNFKNSQNVANNMARVRQEITATNKELRAYMDSEAQQTTLIEAGNKALQSQVTNINQARASNTELLRVRNQLNPAIVQEAKLIEQLNKKMNENNKFIKDNASEYEKQKINIGNYTESIKEALSSFGRFGSVIGDAEKALKILTPAFTSLKTEAQAAFNLIKGGTVDTEKMSAAQAVAATTTNVLSGGLKLLKIALIGTGIGAIVVALGSLVGFLASTQQGIDAVNSVLQPLKAVFTVLGKLFVDAGRALFEAFSNPKKLLSDLVDFLKGQVINRITALKDILQGIIELDFDKVGEGLVQAATGVEDFTDKVKNGFNEIGNSISDAAKKGAEIARITKEIADATLEYNKAQIAVGDELDKNNLIVKDTSRSFKERAAAAEANIAITEKNGQAEKKILELELQRLRIQQELQGLNNLTNEDKQAEIDLLKKIDEAEDRGLNARLENSRVLAGLRKEQADAAAKETDRRLKALQTELDIYVESQGMRKKSMADQIETDREIMRQSLEINKAEFDAKKKTRREYELEVLQIQNDFLAKQVEAQMANADIELELFLLNNQRKIEANAFFSQELYAQELDRINRIAEAEARVQTERYAAGLISLEEYNLAIAQIDQKQYEDNQAVEQERRDAEKERMVAEQALVFEENQVRADYDLEFAKQELEKRFAVEAEALRKKGVSEVSIEKEHAKQRTEIETVVQRNKLQLASEAFGNIGALLGQSSAAGKAVAIAQTTIDTYMGATAAYASLAKIPVYGPALGTAAAAAAITSGLLNVRKIVSTKTPDTGGGQQNRPGYARGVIGLQGVGTGTSDSIDARLSAGESVITAQATSLFPNTLAAINQAGGGVGLDSNLASTIVQNDITERVDNTMNIATIAEAVAQGAAIGTERGSAKGIKDLATDRQIQQNAKF